MEDASRIVRITGIYTQSFSVGITYDLARLSWEIEPPDLIRHPLPPLPVLDKFDIPVPAVDPVEFFSKRDYPLEVSFRTGEKEWVVRLPVSILRPSRATDQMGWKVSGAMRRIADGRIFLPSVSIEVHERLVAVIASRRMTREEIPIRVIRMLRVDTYPVVGSASIEIRGAVVSPGSPDLAALEGDGISIFCAIGLKDAAPREAIEEPIFFDV